MTVTQSRTSMHVRKRNGDTEPVDVNKIVRAVDRVSDDLGDVDPMRVATRTISGLYDGATTAELDRLSIQTAAEIDWSWFEGVDVAGLTAGASAPEDLVTGVIDALRARFQVTQQDVTVTREDVVFKLPRALA